MGQQLQQQPPIISPQQQQQQQRKPRRSIKAEGARLHGMLKDGNANVIDPSKLGKRLSSEIWNSFGAIQVDDNFSYPSIVTKVVPDGSSTMKICQFFVACSKCFSVFKYDGHAYGTTGLVKHVKNCQSNSNQAASSSTTNNTNTNIDHKNFDSTYNSSIPNSISTSTSSNNNVINSNNGPQTTRRRKDTSTSTTNKTNANSPAALRYLTKLSEETRNDLKELNQKVNEILEVKQKINDLVNLLSVPSHQAGQIQIISNDGETMENDLDKN